MRIGKNELKVMEALLGDYPTSTYAGLKEVVTEESPADSDRMREYLLDSVLDDLEQEDGVPVYKNTRTNSKKRKHMLKHPAIQNGVKKMYNISRSSFNQTMTRLMDKGLIQPIFILNTVDPEYMTTEKEAFIEGDFPTYLYGYRNLKISLKKEYSLTKLGRAELEKRQEAK